MVNLLVSSGARIDGQTEVWSFIRYANIPPCSSGIFRISKRGAKCLLATSAHTRGGQTKFSNFFTMSWPKGGAKLAKG